MTRETISDNVRAQEATNIQRQRGRRLRLLALALALTLAAGLLFQIGPLLLWFLNVERAGRLIEQELQWPEPRRVDSLPAAKDDDTLQTALIYLGEAVRWRPAHPYAYRLRGQIYAAQGDWLKAAESFDQAAAVTPRNPLPRWESALIYEQIWRETKDGQDTTGQYANLRPDIRMLEAWQAVGLNADSLIRRGAEAVEAEHYEEGLLWYERAKVADPRAAAPWYYAGLAYKRMGEIDKALEAHQQAVERAPDYRDSWYEMGQIYVARRDENAALHAFQRAMEAPTGTVGLSTIQYRVGSFKKSVLDEADEAWKAFTHALELDDFGDESSLKAATYEQRGSIRQSQGRWEEALVEYQQALVLEPDHYAFRLSLATALWNLERREEAKDSVQQAIEFNPRSENAYRMLGDFYLAEGNESEARAMYEKVLAIDPKNRGARRALQKLNKTTPSP